MRAKYLFLILVVFAASVESSDSLSATGLVEYSYPVKGYYVVGLSRFGVDRFCDGIFMIPVEDKDLQDVVSSARGRVIDIQYTHAEVRGSDERHCIVSGIDTP